MNFHLLITESSSFHIRNLHIDFYTWNIEISCFNVAKPVQVLETYLLESLYCIEDIQQPDVHIKKKKKKENILCMKPAHIQLHEIKSSNIYTRKSMFNFSYAR